MKYCRLPPITHNTIMNIIDSLQQYMNVTNTAEDTPPKEILPGPSLDSDAHTVITGFWILATKLTQVLTICSDVFGTVILFFVFQLQSETWLQKLISRISTGFFFSKVAISFSIGNICSFPYVVKIGYFGCRNSYCGLMRSHRGATYSSPEPCWHLTYFSKPFCSKSLVLDTYLWCKLALNCQKEYH